MNPTCTAIVVARGGSVRLPGKALRPFGDSTLVGHKIDTLRQVGGVPGITRVVCGSDDEAILREAEQHGALPVVRDPRCCDEARSTANEMIADMLHRIEPCNVVLWAHPTNPLIRPETYQRAIDAFLAAERDGFDSLMSVRVEQRHAWHRGEPLNFHPRATRHPLASELEPVLFQDGGIFINRFESMRDRAYFYGDRPFAFPLDPIEGLDIDTPRDYELACLLADHVSRQPRAESRKPLGEARHAA